MALSAVAGIIDPTGGLRVVVTQRWRMHYHIRKGERLFVVPGYEVQEPVPMELWGVVIGRAEDHVRASLAAESLCGSCRLCCKVMYINEDGLHKPSGKWCKHNGAYAGCNIHSSKPKPCSVFECLWLKSQRRNDRMPEELRPDRCGVVFTTDTSAAIGEKPDPLLIEVHPDHDRPWATSVPVVVGWMNNMVLAGWKMKVITHYHGENAA